MLFWISFALLHIRQSLTAYLDHCSPQISGIGLETSLQFAAEGAILVMGDINEPAVRKAAESVSAQFPPSQAVGVKCDVSKEAEVEALVAKAVENFGRLDVMVSSIGNLG